MLKKIYLSPPWMGGTEQARVNAALESGWIAPCGPAVDEFESRLAKLSCRSVAAVSSGTAALDLLMHELEVGPNTTVIASDLTFISTVGPAFHRGAKIAFVDSDASTGTISIPLLEEALKSLKTPNPVIIAADIYGQCCDYDALEDLAERHHARLVIDAAEAVGATCRNRPAGAAGLAAVYSFNGNKLITTSGGGAVLSANRELIDRARWRAQQSREPRPWYEHRQVGYNYRLSNPLAAFGCGQLDAIDEIIRRKRSIFEFYRHELAGRAGPYPCPDWCSSTRWLSVFIYHDRQSRDEVARRLAAANIESRPVWKPMHLQPVFAQARTFGGDVSADLFERGICLPSGAGLDNDDLERIAAALNGE